MWLHVLFSSGLVSTGSVPGLFVLLWLLSSFRPSFRWVSTWTIRPFVTSVFLQAQFQLGQFLECSLLFCCCCCCCCFYCALPSGTVSTGAIPGLFGFFCDFCFPSGTVLRRSVPGLFVVLWLLSSFRHSFSWVSVWTVNQVAAQSWDCTLTSTGPGDLATSTLRHAHHSVVSMSPSQFRNTWVSQRDTGTFPMHVQGTIDWLILYM